jgi:hypothetical protein
MEVSVDKFCRKCNRYLEYKSFHRSKNKSYIDGHISVCKDCIKNKVVVVKEKPVFKVIEGEYIVSFD